jgi:outer membrane protein assembly factor BamE (lipoprotein component of BamABCDE complex)
MGGWFLASQGRRIAVGSLAVVCLGIGAAACSPRIDNHGNKLDAERLAEVIPGTHTRDDVARLFGSPSSVSLFDGEIWYYVGDRTETFAFFEPDVTERQVVVVRFTGQGVVDDMEVFGLDRSRSVDVVERETPTAGNELTVLQQLLGNVGRFEGQKDKK